MIRRLIRINLIAVLLSLALASARADDLDASSPSVLASYVSQRDDSYELREVTSGRIGKTEYVEYQMTSQTWRGIKWKHQFFVLRPTSMRSDVRSGLLFVHGGRWKPEYESSQTQNELPREAKLFARLAESIGAPVGVLRQVPFQPIFERREDALIAYTLDRYLHTGEADWPLLLPMVKSAVRGMDAMQSIVGERWDASLQSFTIAGASKRGWTSWLTAAIDPRVNAVAPMVIDVLNMRAQMDLQRATWGELSDEIRDYATLDLPKQLDTARGQALLQVIDPFSYRDRLTMPKLILLSTNDRYWPLDALRLYWSELPDPKHVLYVPNQGHGLRDVDRVIGGLSAVHRYAAAEKALPGTTWTFAAPSNSLEIDVRADRSVHRVLIWEARAPTRDFREARWVSHPCKKSAHGYVCSATRANRGYTAIFAETAFRDPGSPQFSTTTTICIAGPDPTVPLDC